jgi:hypothetical protein
VGLAVKKVAILLLLLTFWNGAYAVAQEKEVKKQVLSFEDELVEGAVSKPELFYLLEKKSSSFKRLLKLRKNFLPEMRRTSADIHAGGRQD